MADALKWLLDDLKPEPGPTVMDVKHAMKARGGIRRDCLPTCLVCPGGGFLHGEGCPNGR